MPTATLLRSSTLLAIALAMTAAALAGSTPALAGSPPAPDTEASRIQRGYQIAPVTLHTKRLDPALVGLGSYIVNGQGGCNDCHTNPPYAAGHDPFAGQPKQINVEGYLAGGMEFGPFVSRNLTPNDDGLPAGLTWLQFRQVLRTGIDLDHKHPQISPLLQVMPWPVYQSMTDRDLRAIYEYLRAIPSAGEHDD